MVANVLIEFEKIILGTFYFFDTEYIQIRDMLIKNNKEGKIIS